MINNYEREDCFTRTKEEMGSELVNDNPVYKLENENIGKRPSVKKINLDVLNEIVDTLPNQSPTGLFGAGDYYCDNRLGIKKIINRPEMVIRPIRVGDGLIRKTVGFVCYYDKELTLKYTFNPKIIVIQYVFLNEEYSHLNYNYTVLPTLVKQLIDEGKELLVSPPNNYSRDFWEHIGFCPTKLEYKKSDYSTYQERKDFMDNYIVHHTNQPTLGLEFQKTKVFSRNVYKQPIDIIGYYKSNKPNCELMEMLQATGGTVNIIGKEITPEEDAERLRPKSKKEYIEILKKRVDVNYFNKKFKPALDSYKNPPIYDMFIRNREGKELFVDSNDYYQLWLITMFDAERIEKYISWNTDECVKKYVGPDYYEEILGEIDSAHSNIIEQNVIDFSKKS